MKMKFNFMILMLIFLVFSCKETYSQNAGNKTTSESVITANITDLQSALHNIAKNETPSIVYIGTEKTVTQQNINPFDFFFGNPDPRNTPKQRQFKQQALGSGVIYSKKGDSYYIVTNNHVIDGADKITVVVDQKKNYPGKVIGADPDVDIAIVKIDTKDTLKLARFANSNNNQVGDLVIAIGNPFGLSGTMTFGIISAIGRNDIGASSKPSLTDFIQTDASINPGNSGGALLNLAGEVIGINTLIYSQSGGNVGIGFAIPINIAQKIADEVIDTGKKTIDHGYLGVFFEELTEDSVKQFDLKEDTKGILVRSVAQNGPADKAGIKTGDILLEINGKPLLKTSDLTMTVGNSSPGTKLNLKILRDGQTITKEVVLGNRIEMDTAETKSSTTLDEYGLGLAELNNSARDKYKIPANITGVLITSIDQGSRAEQSGLKTGDVVFKVNNKKIAKIEDLNKILKDNKDKTNYFFIFRDGKESIIMM